MGVFQRLYDDALNRVERLDKLRNKIRKERMALKGLSEDEPMSPEVSVLSEIERSELKGLREWTGPGPAAPVSYDRSIRMKPEMKRMTSLPQLHANSPKVDVMNSNVAVLNLDLG